MTARNAKRSISVILRKNRGLWTVYINLGKTFLWISRIWKIEPTIFLTIYLLLFARFWTESSIIKFIKSASTTYSFAPTQNFNHGVASSSFKINIHTGIWGIRIIMSKETFGSPIKYQNYLNRINLVCSHMASKTKRRRAWAPLFTQEAKIINTVFLSYNRRLISYKARNVLLLQLYNAIFPGGSLFGLISAGYLPLASRNPYPIIVYAVAILLTPS